MESIGLSLVVGGFALVISGLIFLLPARRQQSGGQERTDENLEAIHHYLQEIRQQRNDYDERLMHGVLGGSRQ